MAWYPGAERMELQPESDGQPAIRPTQVILHSVAAPWTPRRMFEYWRDSTNLESHFGVGFDGAVAQFVGTQTRADANAQANRRADGTGAVSVETASNLDHTDPWSAAQVAALIELGLWAHRTHGIPVRACRSAADPGFGYHRMFPEWSVGGTACPGDARVRQFHDVILPGIAARAAGQPPNPVPEDDMTPDQLLAARLGQQYAVDGGFVPTVADALNGAAYSTQHAQAARAEIAEARDEIAAVGARVDRLAAAVTAGGSLTDAQLAAAARAGAEAALAALADRLKGGVTR